MHINNTENQTCHLHCRSKLKKFHITNTLNTILYPIKLFKIYEKLINCIDKIAEEEWQITD